MYPPLTVLIGVLTAVVLAVNGCAPVRVSTFVLRGTDFQAYRTYAWASKAQLATGDPRLDNNEMFQRTIQAAVAKELAARGFERLESGHADLVLHYHASVTQRVDANGADEKYGYCDECRPFVFEAGTLTLDFVDARTNRLVWRGWAESSLDGLIDNQAWLERRVGESVAKIIQKLPGGTL